ncbi:uncharacterized protein KY384_004017 [Bacidia gigantensis]|uniref:uncharacterized protein n=1 Tax=Bacidia gigantensis TaxID=2732470 RepID=UPI001D05AFEA|nr:uncharacterized protein KY384_004017 [Bacidia gigantensis]KAG8530662.1 hypothetical protein KY384_004017 [Bacidia gigantensis]
MSYVLTTSLGITTGKNGMTTSLISTQVSDFKATGTYELATLSEYSNLRQHMTITTTQSATTSGNNGLETVAAVVLAGGVAWFLADFSGAAAAAAALKPPDSAENHEDDKQCPDPEHKCSECDGKLDICTSGKDSGCACKPADCPADEADDQPKCSDPACNGKDDKCTTGDHTDCNCKKDECPADGHDDQPKCSDDTCKDLLKDPLFCTDCGGYDDQGKCKGVGFLDPAQNNKYKSCDCLREPDFSKHSGPSKRPDAQKHFEALKRLIRKGAKSTDPKPSDSPEPGSKPDGTTPTCDENDVSNIDNMSWGKKPMYQSFCDTINGGDPKAHVAMIVDIEGNKIPNKKRALFERTPPSDPGQWNDYTFSLIWTGGDGSCDSDCGNFMGSMSGNTCGHLSAEQNKMANKIAVDTGCGKYTMGINAPPGTVNPHGTNPDPSPTCYTKDKGYTTFNVGKASEAIDKFCQILHDQKSKISGLARENSQTFARRDKKGVVKDGKKTLTLNVNWATSPTCADPGNKGYDFGEHSVDDCKKNFGLDLLPKCPSPDDQGGKDPWTYGGWVVADCVAWTVAAQ